MMAIVPRKRIDIALETWRVSTGIPHVRPPNKYNLGMFQFVLPI